MLTRMKTRCLCWALMVLGITGGCRTSDPARHFIAETDRKPETSRPVGWEGVKRLMARPAPVVGQPAPDFSLATLDGTQTLTCSAYQQGRPLVLIFGSFT
jgi:hypothetical protein